MYFIVCHMITCKLIMFLFFFSIFRPYACLLGQIPGTDIYRDVTVYKEVSRLIINISCFD